MYEFPASVEAAMFDVTNSGCCLPVNSCVRLLEHRTSLAPVVFVFTALYNNYSFLTTMELLPDRIP